MIRRFTYSSSESIATVRVPSGPASKIAGRIDIPKLEPELLLDDFPMNIQTLDSSLQYFE